MVDSKENYKFDLGVKGLIFKHLALWIQNPINIFNKTPGTQGTEWYLGLFFHLYIFLKGVTISLHFSIIVFYFYLFNLFYSKTTKIGRNTEISEGIQIW